MSYVAVEALSQVWENKHHRKITLEAWFLNWSLKDVGFFPQAESVYRKMLSICIMGRIQLFLELGKGWDAPAAMILTESQESLKVKYKT